MAHQSMNVPALMKSSTDLLAAKAYLELLSARSGTKLRDHLQPFKVKLTVNLQVLKIMMNSRYVERRKALRTHIFRL